MKPILFSTEMVKAILDGRKTQTRRVIKPQPAGSSTWIEHEKSGRFYPNNYKAHPDALISPYGKVGDRLWVRETWAYRTAGIGYVYRADGEQMVERWKPSIHMPREACRLMLEVTNVRVERVQDISHSDAMAEGINDLYEGGVLINPPFAVMNFAKHWDSINAKRGYGWDKSPWVWVIEFKVAENG